MPITIIVLFLASFCIGTTEFVIAGLLPEISGDLAISLPVAGYLVSAYAIGVAIGGPVITLAIARMPRKTSLLVLMSVFIAGHVWLALAPNFWFLLAGRLIVAMSHGAFYGIAGVVAVKIVAENRRGAAVAWLFAGVSIANILGVPGGTAIGNWLGWRATFWIVGSLAAAVAVTMMIVVPKDRASDRGLGDIRAQFSALANQKVLLSYVSFAAMLIAFWTFFTFVAPYLMNVAAIAPDRVPVLLFLFGIGATCGTFLGGRLVDRYPIGTLIAMGPLQVVAWVAVGLSGNHPVVVGGILMVFGTIAFLPGSAIVNRVLKGAAKAPDLASTLVSTAANIGIAVGAVIGSQALSAGVGYAQLPWVSAFFALVAGGVMVFSLYLERRASILAPASDEAENLV